MGNSGDRPLPSQDVFFLPYAERVAFAICRIGWMHVRGPSFINLQTMPHLLRDGLIADGVAIISSVDPIMGEVDR